jgi:hypothetical protein
MIKFCQNLLKQEGKHLWDVDTRWDNHYNTMGFDGLASEVQLRSFQSGEWGAAEIFPVWWLVAVRLSLCWRPGDAAVAELANASDSGAVGEAPASVTSWRSLK